MMQANQQNLRVFAHTRSSSTVVHFEVSLKIFDLVPSFFRWPLYQRGRATKNGSFSDEPVNQRPI